MGEAGRLQAGKAAFDDGPTAGGLSGSAAAKQVPAVAKAIAIIRHLNGGPSTGRSLVEIAADLNITKSHCHNVLKTLVAQGWAVFDASRRRYTLAPGLLADVSRLISRGTRPLLIHEELVKLSLAAGVPCVLTRVDSDNSFVAIDKAEEAAELLVSVPIGHRFPADAPAQMKARLACVDDAAVASELARWRPVARTPTTITDRQELKRDIEACRQRGYSTSRGEYTTGVMSLAVAVRDKDGIARLIVQCPGVQADMEEREAKIAALLIKTGWRIGELVSGHNMGEP